jgi:small conductance mechanosensitive channel
MTSTLFRLAGLGLLLCLVIAGPLRAAEEAAVDIRDMVEQLEQSVEELRALYARIESVPEASREALVYRRDGRTIQALQQLDRLVRKAAELPEDDPQRTEVQGRLREDLVGAGTTVMARLDEIGQRITHFRAEAKAASGGERVTIEAYLYSLDGLRFRYYEALVNVVDGREALGMPAEEISHKLQQRLYLHAEALVGQIVFTGTGLGDIRARQKQDPENADIAAALNYLSARQRLDLVRLRTMAGLIGRLGQDASAYNAVLVKQSEGLSLAVLEKGVLKSMVTDGWENARDTLVDQTPDLVFKLLVFVVIFLIFRLLARLTRRAVEAACERPGVDVSALLKDMLKSMSGGTVMAIGILMALSQVGISLGPMLAGLGVAGFIVGFALQDTLGNFAAGGMILIYRPYDVDDFVEVAGATGFVKKMSLVSTTIATIDNQTLVVPNSKIWGDVIKNVTAQRLRRVDLVFGIGYGEDIEQAERVLNAILEENEQVLNKPEAMVKVHELGDSSVNFVVRPWVKTDDYWDVYWDITREVKMRFDREGISIPFPQRDVHIYREEA